MNFQVKGFRVYGRGGVESAPPHLKQIINHLKFKTMTLRELKNQAAKEGIFIHSVNKVSYDQGYWIGYKVCYVVELGSNTVSAETSIEIAADSYDELAEQLYKFE